MKMQRQGPTTLTLFSVVLTLFFVASAVCVLSDPVEAQQARRGAPKEGDGEEIKEEDKVVLSREAQKALFECQEAMKVEDYEGGRQWLLDYLATEPEDVPAVLYLMLGGTYYQQEMMKEAREAFKQGYEVEPTDMSLLLNYALTTMELEMYLEAAPLFEQVFAGREDRDSRFLYQAAIAYYQGEDLVQAKRVLKQLIELPEEPQPVWYELLIQLCMEREEMEEAEMYVKQFLAIQPLRSDYWQLLAQLRLDKEDYKGGAAALEIAYSIKSPKRRNWEDLAEMYAYLAAPIRSAQTLVQGYKQEITEEGYLRIADYYSRAQRYDKAVSYVDALLQEKKTPDLLLEKGKRLYDGGRLSEAIKTLQDCVKLDPEQAEAYLLIGFASWDLEKWSQARKAFTNAQNKEEFRFQAEDAIAIIDDMMSVRIQEGDNLYKRKFEGRFAPPS